MSIDLRHKFLPVFDQGCIASCSANALCALIGFICPGFFGSRLFMYYNERLFDGTIGRDEGVEVGRAVESLVRYGVCNEALWPYIPARLDLKPDSRCYKSIKRFSASTIPKRPDALKHALIEDRPFVVGLVVYESFRQVNQSGDIPMPQKEKEKCLGGHAVVCVGFRDDYWIMRNCWGSGWGDAGHFYLPSAYLFDVSLTCSEPWCLESCEDFRFPSCKRSRNRGGVLRHG